MKFSIIIPLRKIGNYLREAIPHFLSQSFQDFEIIVVSEAEESESFPKTRIIKVGQVPPAEKRNTGVSKAKGEIIAFIDDDAYPRKDWLETANKIFEDKKIVAVGGPSLVPEKASFFQQVSSKVYELTSGKTGIRYRQDKPQEIDDWPTCNFFVRKKVFNEIKGFKTKYWGGEDTQLCYSLLKKGRMVYSPELVIYHHPRTSLGKHLKQTYFWGMWRGFFMRLYKQSRQLSFFIPSLFVLWIALGGFASIILRPLGYLYIAFLFVYLLYLFYLGIKTDAKMFFPVIFTTFLTHISYGLGFLKGILSMKSPINKTLNPSENIKIK